MMIADLYFSLQFAAICGFSANTLQLKNKTKKEQTNKKNQTQKVPMNMKFSGPHPPAHPSLHGRGGLVSPCEGYSLFLGTGLCGGPFLP